MTDTATQQNTPQDPGSKFWAKGRKAALSSWLRLFAHTIILCGPLIVADVFHQSDNMLNMTNSSVNTTITEISFSLRRFSANGRGGEAMEFSDEQQDMFGDKYASAHAIYHVLTAIMWIALVAPLVGGLVYKVLFNFSVTRKEFTARLTRIYAKISSPILIITTMLLIVPFFLLWSSDLCGASTNYERLNDHDDDLLLVGNSCQITGSGKVYLSGVGFYYPLILMVNAYTLLLTANRLDDEIANEKARMILASSSHGPVIKVLDPHEDDYVHSDTETAADDDDEIENGSSSVFLGR